MVGAITIIMISFIFLVNNVFLVEINHLNDVYRNSFIEIHLPKSMYVSVCLSVCLWKLYRNSKHNILFLKS